MSSYKHGFSQKIWTPLRIHSNWLLRKIQKDQKGVSTLMSIFKRICKFYNFDVSEKNYLIVFLKMWQFKTEKFTLLTHFFTSEGEKTKKNFQKFYRFLKTFGKLGTIFRSKCFSFHIQKYWVFFLGCTLKIAFHIVLTQQVKAQILELQAHLL